MSAERYMMYSLPLFVLVGYSNLAKSIRALGDGSQAIVVHRSFPSDKKPFCSTTAFKSYVPKERSDPVDIR